MIRRRIRVLLHVCLPAVLLLFPFVVAVQFGAWLGGLVLVGRAIRTIGFVEEIGLEVFALEELTASGSRLQRVLELFRKGMTLFRPVEATE